MTDAEKVCATLRDEACTQGPGGTPCSACLKDNGLMFELAVAGFVEAAQAIRLDECALNIAINRARYDAALKRLAEVIG